MMIVHTERSQESVSYSYTVNLEIQLTHLFFMRSGRHGVVNPAFLLLLILMADKVP